MTSHLANSPLKSLREELELTLKRAHLALESYLEDTEETASLELVADCADQVRGVFVMLDCPEAAFMLEEMAALARRLAEGEIDNPEAAREVLLRSVLQISLYLEGLQRGVREPPAGLQPLTNELRTVRGLGPIKGEIPPALAGSAWRKTTPDLRTLAGQLRPALQRALIGVVRGQAIADNLGRIAAVFAQFRAAAASEAPYRLWWLAEGLALELRGGGLNLDRQSTFLLRDLDHQVRLMLEEEVDPQQPPDPALEARLLEQLKASDSGRRRLEERTDYQPPTVPEGVIDELAPPDADTLLTIATYLKEALTLFKDAMDRFVRSDERALASLAEEPTRLRQVGNVLALLNMSVSSQLLYRQAQILEQWLDRAQAIDDDQLFSLAGELILVEDSLDGILEFAYGLEAEEGGESQRPRLSSFGQGQARFAVARELITDMARARELASLHINRTDEPAAWADLLPILHNTTGVLTLLECDAVVRLMGALEATVRDRSARPEPVEGSFIDAFAEILVALEYYLEQMGEGRTPDDRLLEVAEGHLARLRGEPVPAVLPTQLRKTAAPRPDSQEVPPPVIEVQRIEPDPGEAPVIVERTAPAVEAPLEEETGLPSLELQPLEPQGEAPPLELVPQESGAEDLSLELDLSAPLEEAGSLELDLPHTSEDSTLEVELPDEETPGTGMEVDFLELEELEPLGDAREVRPEEPFLQEGEDLELQLEAPEEDLASLVEALDTARLRETDQEETRQPVEEPLDWEPAGELSVEEPPVEPKAEQPRPPVPVPPQPEVDPEFLEIFLEEARGELVVIGDALAAWRRNPADRQSLTTVRRAFHTLKGSGRMVGQTLVGECAWHFEDLLNQVLAGHLPPAPQIQDLVAEVRQVLERVVGPAPGRGDEAEAIAALEARVTAIRSGEQPLEEAAEEAQAPYQEELAWLGVALARGRHDTALVHDLLDTFHGLGEQAEERQEGAIRELTAALEDYLQRLDEARLPLSEAGMELCLEAARRLEHLAAGRAPDTAALVARVRELAEGVETAPLAPTIAFPQVPTAPPPPPQEQTAAPPAPELDPELLEVFLAEGEELLNACDVILRRWSSDTGNLELLNDLRREVHTLKGNSRLTGLMAIGDLAHTVESLLDAVAVGRAAGSAPVADALQLSLDRFNAMLEQVRQEGRPPAPADDLIQDLKDLLEASIGVSEEVSAAPALTQRDRELVQVYLPEATEITEAGDRLLRQLRAEPDDHDPLNELRRRMHTLKGSSRMAGFVAIGDLAHAAEALLEAMASGRLTLSGEVVEGLQTVMDRFGEMLVRVREDQEVEPADDLVRELARLQGLPVVEPQAEPQAEPQVIPIAPPAPTRVAVATGGADTVRVSARLLDNLVNQAGESSIFRARIDQGVGNLRFNLNELDQTVARLRQQLRRLEIETEAQILFRYEEGAPELVEEFDPLELDRFSELQQLSRSLMEIVDDLANLKNAMEDHTQEIGFLLDQQSKVQKEIQQGLMKTRMVPFDSVVPRLRRVVRQAAQELGRQAELTISGSEAEVERTVLEHMIPPLEHMLRNAVSHGIEAPAQRREAGKPESGTVTLDLHREGSELVVTLSDDGQGLDFEAIRRKGEDRGILTPGVAVEEEDLIALLLRPGFSTARQVTQVAGRGVGLDVLATAVRSMRGALQVRSRPGQGAVFIIRLPFSLAVTQALMVEAGGETYAIPLLGIEAVTRLSSGELQSYIRGDDVIHEYGGQRYPLHGLGVLFGGGLSRDSIKEPRPAAVLFRSAEASAALQVDRVIGSQEVIVKPVAPQLLSVPGISGATVLGDGRVVVVLEVAALVRRLASQAQRQAEARALSEVRRETRDQPLNIMVIDDSITMRKVTARFLERQGAAVVVAKDGIEAVGLLEERTPDLVLLDIEMPRMDGFELTKHIRNQPHLRHLPVIMVTSRTGEKHRDRAASLGVNDYLGKPYQEEELLAVIRKALGNRADELRT